MLAPAPRHAVLLVLLALGCESKSTKGAAGSSSPRPRRARNRLPRLSPSWPRACWPRSAATRSPWASTQRPFSAWIRSSGSVTNRPIAESSCWTSSSISELLAEEARRRGLDKQPETQERVRQMLRDELLVGGARLRAGAE